MNDNDKTTCGKESSKNFEVPKKLQELQQLNYDTLIAAAWH
jgi:hypothetical protein